jgi:hypothetical protein
MRAGALGEEAKELMIGRGSDRWIGELGREMAHKNTTLAIQNWHNCRPIFNTCHYTFNQLTKYSQTKKQVV